MANSDAFNNMKEAYTKGRKALKDTPQDAQWVKLPQGIAQRLLNHMQDAEGTLTWTDKLEEAKKGLEASLVVRSREVTVPRLALYSVLQFTSQVLRREQPSLAAGSESQAAKAAAAAAAAAAAPAATASASQAGAAPSLAATSAKGATSGNASTGASASDSGRASTATTSAATPAGAAGAAGATGAAGARVQAQTQAAKAAAASKAAKAAAAAAAAAAAVVPPQNEEELRTHELRSSSRRQAMQLALQTTAAAIRDAAKKEARNSEKEGTSLLTDVDFELEKVDKGYQSVEDSLRRTADMHFEAAATCRQMAERQASSETSPFDHEGTLRTGEEKTQDFRTKSEKLEEITSEAMETRSNLCDQLVQLRILNSQKNATKTPSNVLDNSAGRSPIPVGSPSEETKSTSRSSVELLTKLQEAQDECSTLSQQSQSLRSISEQLAFELRQVAPRIWKNQRASKHVLGLTAQLEDLQISLNKNKAAKQSGDSKEQAIVAEASVLRRLQILAEEVFALRAGAGLFIGKEETQTPQEPPLKKMKLGACGPASSLEAVEREELRGKLASSCSLIRNAAAALTSERIWQATCAKQSALRMKEQEERVELSRILDRRFAPDSVSTKITAMLPLLPPLSAPSEEAAAAAEAEGRRRPAPLAEIAAALDKAKGKEGSGSDHVLEGGKLKELLEQATWVEEEKIVLEEGLLQGAQLSAKAGWLAATNLIAGSAASAAEPGRAEEESRKRKAKLQELEDKKGRLFEDLAAATKRLRNEPPAMGTAPAAATVPTATGTAASIMTTTATTASSSSSSASVGAGQEAQEELAKMAELIQQQVSSVKARATEILKAIPVQAEPPVVEGSELLDSRSALPLAENSARVAALHRELQAVLQQGKVSMQAWAASLRCERAKQDLELASSCREVLKSFLEDAPTVFSALKTSKEEHRVLSAELEKLLSEGKARAEKRAMLQSKCSDYDETMESAKRDLEATQSTNKDTVDETPSFDELREAQKKAKEALQAQKDRNQQLQAQFGTFNKGGQTWTELAKADKELEALTEKIRQDKLRLSSKRNENARAEKKNQESLQAEEARVSKNRLEVESLEATVAESKKKREALEELKRPKDESLAAKKREWEAEEKALLKKKEALEAQAVLVNKEVKEKAKERAAMEKEDQASAKRRDFEMQEAKRQEKEKQEKEEQERLAKQAVKEEKPEDAKMESAESEVKEELEAAKEEVRDELAESLAAVAGGPSDAKKEKDEEGDDHPGQDAEATTVKERTETEEDQEVTRETEQQKEQSEEKEKQDKEDKEDKEEKEVIDNAMPEESHIPTEQQRKREVASEVEEAPPAKVQKTGGAGSDAGSWQPDEAIAAEAESETGASSPAPRLTSTDSAVEVAVALAEAEAEISASSGSSAAPAASAATTGVPAAAASAEDANVDLAVSSSK